MKNKLWVKILYILTLIIQVGIVIGTFVVEYLTNKKAGVMHHVYYRRYQFENGIFSQSNINPTASSCEISDISNTGLSQS